MLFTNRAYTKHQDIHNQDILSPLHNKLQHSIAEASKLILGRAWREPTRTRYITRSMTVY